MFFGLPLSIFVVPLLAFAVSLVLVWWLIKGNAPKVLDHPNTRSLHTEAVPRTGGIGLMLGVLASWALLPAMLPLPVWVGVGLLMAVSFTDDVFSLPIGWRLLMHGVAAAWFAAALLFDAYGWMIAATAVVAIIWMTNLYNFMDGSNGLAGGMTLFGFGFYGFSAWLAGNELFAMLNVCVAAAAIAFLLFNFHHARIFMGDVGSIPLGFLAAASGIVGYLEALWPAWFPILIFSPFIADASVTLIKRLLRGDKIWQAHREHYYQRLILLGLSHRRTALLEYALMLTVGITALWGVTLPTQGQAVLLAAWMLIYAALALFIEWRWREARD